MLRNRRKNCAEVRHLQERVPARRQITNADQARKRFSLSSGGLRFLDNGNDASKAVAGAVRKA